MLPKPDEVLNGLVADGVELIRARDPDLAAKLDVPPPAPPSTLAQRVMDALTAKGRPLLYRGARGVYLSLRRIGPLQPVMARLKHSFQRRIR